MPHRGYFFYVKIVSFLGYFVRTHCLWFRIKTTATNYTRTHIRFYTFTRLHIKMHLQSVSHRTVHNVHIWHSFFMLAWTILLLLVGVSVSVRNCQCSARKKMTLFLIWSNCVRWTICRCFLPSRSCAVCRDDLPVNVQIHLSDCELVCLCVALFQFCPHSFGTHQSNR